MTPEGQRLLDELYRSHWPYMVNLANKRAGCRERAHDLAMNALLKLAPRIETIAPAALPAYWQRAVVNLMITEFRRAQSARVVSLDELNENSEMPWQIGAALPPVYERAERAQRDALVREAVAALRPHHRRTLQLYYGNGLSILQIAALDGIATGTVKSRLKRARRGVERKIKGFL